MQRSYLTFIAFFLLVLGLHLPVQAQIRAGQAVQITIMGVPPEEKAKVDAVYPVSDSGTVNLPFIGNVRAAGLRPEMLAQVIQNAYRSAEIYTNPTIQVVSTAESGIVEQQVVHVGGSVRRTGPVPYQRGLTIYQAIQAAGGENEFGTIRRVRLLRGGNLREYDLSQIQFRRVPLEPNDTIEVPQKNWLGR